MKNSKSVQWLRENMMNEDVILLDCRANLIDAQEGPRMYREGHIPGAYFIDTKKDLSGLKGKHGGRHPLPQIETLQKRLEEIGITENTTIIAYDDNKLFTAARLWWQLKYLGHDKVFLLDGGIDKWVEKGYSLTKDIPENGKRGKINIKLNKNMIIDAQEIRKRLGDKDFIILDARSKERYLGQKEPVDKIPGHIPGAKLYVAKENLKETGEWKTQKELEKRFERVIPYRDIALYCGSGINACLNFIALDELGVRPKLYPGSWSDWITYEGYPISREEE